MLLYNSKKDAKYYINAIIGLAIVAIFWNLPPYEPITEVGMKILGLFIGACWLWSTVEMVWPSMMLICGIGLTGYTNIPGALALCLGDDVVWMCIFSMAIVGAITSVGLNDYIVSAMMGNKIINGRPWVFTGVFLGACMIFCCLVNYLIGFFLFWAMIEEIAAKFGYKKGDKYIMLLYMGTMVTGMMAANILPFKNMPLFVISTLKNMVSIELEYSDYMLVSIPLSVAYVVGYTLFMRFIMRCDVTNLANINASDFKKDLPPMNSKQKFMLTYLLVFIGTIIVLSFMPKTSFLGQLNSKLGVVGIMMCYFVLLSILQFNGKSGLVFSEVSKNIYWDMPILLGSAIGVSDILMSDATGIKTLVSNWLSPIFTGMSPLVFLIAILVLAVILTNIGNNLVVCFVMLPIAVALSATVAINLQSVVTLLLYAVLIAYLLPSSCATVAMLFALPLVDEKQWIKYAVPVIICSTVILLGVGIPLCNIFFN